MNALLSREEKLDKRRLEKAAFFRWDYGCYKKCL